MKGYDGGIVAEECHHRAECGNSGQIEQWAHQGAEHVFEKFNNTKFDEKSSDGSCYNAYSHEVEYRVEQQVMGRVHDCVKHVGHTHYRPDIIEESENYGQTYYA